MLKNLKNNKKKGFTLVELIVVLVILAILAALLIPALTGYIDKAKEKKIIAETRQLVMASQTIADEQYAKMDEGVGFNEEVTIASTGTGIVVATKKATLTIGKDDLKKLAEITIKDTDSYSVKIETSGKIKEAIYTVGDQKCTYNGTSYEVVTK